MNSGTDIFRIMNLVIQIMRMFSRIFGDEAEQKAVSESEERTASENTDESC